MRKIQLYVFCLEKIKIFFLFSLFIFISYFSCHISFHVPFPDVGAFVVNLLPLAQPKLHLYPALFEIKRQGDKGIAFFLDLAVYALDFVPVEEKTFFAVGIVVEYR